MATRMPTQRGDVLILHTAASFTIYGVGAVFEDGQQEFDRHAQHVKYVHNRAAAVAKAKALAAPGRRIFLQNIDTDEWWEISS